MAITAHSDYATVRPARGPGALGLGQPVEPRLGRATPGPVTAVTQDAPYDSSYRITDWPVTARLSAGVMGKRSDSESRVPGTVTPGTGNPSLASISSYSSSSSVESEPPAAASAAGPVGVRVSRSHGTACQ
jgi:hypothetical protein